MADDTLRIFPGINGGPKEPEPALPFDQLFDRYYPQLVSFFRKHGLSLEEARDLAQETFLGALQSQPNFRNESSFSTWLFGIGHNVWCKSVRHQTAAKRTATKVPLDEATEQPALLTPSGESNPSQQILRTEVSQQVRQAVASLPPQMRQCLLLRLDQDLKYREIAELLQISIQTVRSQLSKARQKVKLMLEEPASPSESKRVTREGDT